MLKVLMLKKEKKEMLGETVICIPMADSSWYMTKTNTYFKVIILQLKTNKLKNSWCWK